MKRNLIISIVLSFILLTALNYHVNAQPNLSEILIERWWGGPEWHDGRKHVFEYPEDNKIIETRYGITETPGEWGIDARITTVVDAHGNKTEETTVVYFPSEQELPTVLYKNTYENGRLSVVIFSPKEFADLGIWMFRDLYVYDNGKLVQITHQAGASGDYSDIERTVYHYNGNVIDYFTTVEQWDEGSSTWQFGYDSKKYIHQYSGGRLATEELLNWDEDAMDWEKDYFNEYTYNDDGSVRIKLVKSWSDFDNAYGNEERWIYSYGATSAARQTASIPHTFSLSNYPNPFNLETTLQFSIHADSRTSLDIFDVSGRKVRSLIAGEIRRAGVHQLKWDGRDDAGLVQPSGVYTVRLSTPDRTISKTCLLIK